MQVAHVVFDLPLEGHFDYSIPEALIPHVVVGVKVKVTFGSKPMVGLVIALAQDSVLLKLKPIKDIISAQIIFDGRDLVFAKQFADYYGCSLGEALTVMTRHRKRPPVLLPSAGAPKTSIHHCPDGKYLPIIEKEIDSQRDFYIIVPDAHVANALGIPKALRPFVGLRSSMFEAFTLQRLIIMIDDDNSSFKQEQSPMYEARQALLMAQAVYGFDLCFIGASPSVELMSLVHAKKADYQWCAPKTSDKPVVIDLTNYKFLDKGILSPPVRNILQNNINVKKQSIVLLNRRGGYSVTRCSECGHILKCQRCDSAISFSRSQHEFICRHCAYHTPQSGSCPSCKKNNWKSFGMGVEQLQKEIAALFPLSKIAYFEKDTEALPKNADILIATQAILRFKGQVRVQTMVLVDFDGEINRADMRSSFKGWSQAVHARILSEQLLIQTRNPQHHVLKALKNDDTAFFYAEELRLRHELGFTPFYHWVSVVVRSKIEKIAQTTAQDVYNKLIEQPVNGVKVVAVTADIPAKLRDQYRYKLMAGGQDVTVLMRSIKQALTQVKRNKAIITFNVDA